jgi:hypothetical protein
VLVAEAGLLRLHLREAPLQTADGGATADHARHGGQDADEHAGEEGREDHHGQRRRDPVVHQVELGILRVVDREGDGDDGDEQ